MIDRKTAWAYAIGLVTGEAGNETQYGIHETEDTVILSIQGSVEPRDWLYNFDFLAAPYRHSPVPWLVHQGFAKCWKAARDQITGEVMPLLSGGKKLFITGYSHGAAIALLAHEFFKYQGYAPETCLFGCPRVLWLPGKAIRDRFKEVTLYQNRGDIVTHVPFAWAGFRHIGLTHKIGKPRCISVDAHLLAAYTSSLAALEGRVSGTETIL